MGVASRAHGLSIRGYYLTSQAVVLGSRISSFAVPKASILSTSQATPHGKDRLFVLEGVPNHRLEGKKIHERQRSFGLFFPFFQSTWQRGRPFLPIYEGGESIGAARKGTSISLSFAVKKTCDSAQLRKKRGTKLKERFQFQINWLTMQ